MLLTIVAKPDNYCTADAVSDTRQMIVVQKPTKKN